MMWAEIEHEKKRAQHLFYVSLKYTKTGDVILNLIERWQKLIELCMEVLLNKAKKAKKLSIVPAVPKARELAVRRIYKDELIAKVMDLYAFFRKLPSLEKIREHEFRKNVALRVLEEGKEIVINMEKLKEWDELLCVAFIAQVRHLAKCRES